MSSAMEMDPGRPAGRPDPDTQSLGELVSALTTTMSRLMRQEVALAKAETKREMTTAARGMAMFAAAGALLLVALILASFALAQWLNEFMHLGLAYLLVAILWVVVAGVLFTIGKRTVSEVTVVPERTAESIQEIPQDMKGSAR